MTHVHTVGSIVTAAVQGIACETLAEHELVVSMLVNVWAFPACVQANR